MKIGVIGLSSDGGLGNQTWEVCEHLRPAKVLLVIPSMMTKLAARPERFDSHSLTLAKWGATHELDEAVVRTWLEGLDVVYAAETFYDWRLVDWARDAGVRLVCHVNPELFRAEWAEHDVTWWTATDWQHHNLPVAAKVVPMPVAAERFDYEYHATERLKIVHIGGVGAMEDRNGTLALFEALDQIRRPCDISIFMQTRRIPAHGRWPKVTVTVRQPVPSYWMMYRNADMLLLPRRYGGLSLVAQEGLAAGLTLAMPGISPNETWPGPRFSVGPFTDITMLGGSIPVARVTPHNIAAFIADYDYGRREQQAEMSRAWALEHSWLSMISTWRTELEAAMKASL